MCLCVSLCACMRIGMSGCLCLCLCVSSSWRKRGELRSVPRGARTCARMGRGRPGLIRGCLSHTSRRCPDLLSGCRVVCRGDKHEKCAWLQQTGPALALKVVAAILLCTGAGPRQLRSCPVVDVYTCKLDTRGLRSRADVGPPWWNDASTNIAGCMRPGSVELHRGSSHTGSGHIPRCFDPGAINVHRL
jgi:hypothetical protein